MAGNFLGRMAAGLVTLPATVVRQFGEAATASGDEKLLAVLRRPPTAVDNMNPRHTAIRTLASIRVDPNIPAHSIIAVEGDGPKEKGDDGVVAYQSAHIDEAVSELLVRWNHSVQGHPAAIEEVRRILLEHAATPKGPRPVTRRIAAGLGLVGFGLVNRRGHRLGRADALLPGAGIRDRPHGDRLGLRRARARRRGGAGRAASALAAALAFAVAFALVLVVWGSVRPSNDRDWQPEVGRADRPQHPELRLPHGNRLHARLLRSHVRSAPHGVRERRNVSPAAVPGGPCSGSRSRSRASGSLAPRNATVLAVSPFVQCRECARCFLDLGDGWSVRRLLEILRSVALRRRHLNQ